ncbi:MAG: RhuM family protein [Bacteroidales bacterium]|nr:RhuM family protein [Bacteroidales bacterium]
MKNEIIIYQTDEQSVSLEVKIEEDTLWLTQNQIVELFDSSKANISEHIKNIFQTLELEEKTTVRKIRTVQTEGERKVSRELQHYNLDMIISIGYRVNSIRGTQFRIWANQVLKDYLLKGYAVNQRVDRIENDMHKVKKEIGDIKVQLNTSLPPNQGVFYDGQTFDAYVFVAQLIKSAKKSIILIDNYVDESVLTLLSKRNKAIDAVIYTKTISKQLELDIKKHNQQYPAIEVKVFTKSHDRFLIIDNEIVYHIGASLKDLGKNWVAFSKMKLESFDMINRLGI